MFVDERIRSFSSLAWAVVVALARPAAAADVTIAQGGKSVYRIALPAKPTPEETYAATELQQYLKRATGATRPMAQGADPSAGPVIVVSRADAEPARSLLAAPGVPEPTEHDEAIVVARVGDDLLLTGRAPYAVAYAVYDFLENEVGCAWLFPGNLGEEVPRHETLRIGTLGRSHAPRA